MKQSNRDLKQPKPRPEATGEFVGLRIQPALLTAIDDWRRHQNDIPGRSEAIRRLVEQALAGEPKGKRG
jgi:metal-responsive CopG/Arc/MetJ family transcriptional regulator